MLDTVFDVVPNVADGLEVLTGWVLKLPVFVPFPWIHWTNVATSHGDDHIGGLHRLGREYLRSGCGYVDAFFGHGFDYHGIELIGWFRTGRTNGDSTVAKVSKVTSGHLRSPRVVDADE